METEIHGEVAGLTPAGDEFIFGAGQPRGQVRGRVVCPLHSYTVEVNLEDIHISDVVRLHHHEDRFPVLIGFEDLEKGVLVVERSVEDTDGQVVDDPIDGKGTGTGDRDLFDCTLVTVPLLKGAG